VIKVLFLDADLCVHFANWALANTRPNLSGPVAALYSLSKTTKLILLDSLLQEVCISSGSDGSLALSSLGLSVCLSQSQTYFFGAKESPLNKQMQHM
jgi:hypothetical protein